jgi:molecular chaperone HtpG
VSSNKDSFLRELISNASDALDKLRLEALRNKDLNVDTSDLHVEIEVDKDPRTLTVHDNGIGMTHEEVLDLIGTLAKSGTAELRQKLREAKNAAASGGTDRSVRYRFLFDVHGIRQGRAAHAQGRRK